jgi:hypothetical protein
MALFSIGSFLTIFVVGIVWATRPAHKHNPPQHGTSQNE